MSADPALRSTPVAVCPTDATSAAAWTLRLLAHRIVGLTAEVDDLQARITNAVNRSTPRLLERNGVGLDTAASLLITAGDNPQRLGSDAAFAALCGASPIEASSGKTPASSPQPGRRPASRRRPVPHCLVPPALGSPHPGLHDQTPQAGQV